VLKRQQLLKFFESEENIIKMKNKLLPLTNEEGDGKDIKVSYYTMVSA